MTPVDDSRCFRTLVRTCRCSSSSQYLSHFATPVCTVKFQMCSIHAAHKRTTMKYQKALIQQTTCIVRRQPNINLTATLDLESKTRDETRTASVSEQLRTTSTAMSHKEILPRLSTLSQNTIGHGGCCNSAHHKMFISTHVQDRNVFLYCLGACDRSYSFEFFKNFMYFLMSCGSFVVSDSLFDLLADVSHLGLVFSVHFFFFR